ncbi:MAG: transglycosylase domain-containing protein [Proteobacteria bacterium]|nr:transglycosylase domain-containing protein [Pseudomonadota bacterium]
MKKTLRTIAAFFAVLLIGVALSPMLFYLYGLHGIPDEALAAPPQVLPATATSTLWASLGGAETPQIERNNPYTFLWRFFNETSHPQAPESRATELGSQALLKRVPDFWSLSTIRRLLVSVSAYIWVGRHWTAEQALSAYLGQAYFGHGFFGLEAAAQGYFGSPSAQLGWEQMAHLVVVTRAPSRFDPWCNPDRNQEAARQTLSRLPQAQLDKPIHLIAAPADACSE